MSTIQAWQHIYSNVEKEQSPQGRGGFQTLFYSKGGLAEAEVEEMESRLLYFPSKVEPVKRLFFTTSTGKGVVAQVVSVPSPDQYGRGGRYLAHSLIFEPEAMFQFEVEPFLVFRHFSFASTVAEALALGEFKTGNIPPVSLPLSASLAGDLQAARAWSAPELQKLAMLALRVEQQAQQRNALTVTGEPEQILDALEAAFLSVPLSLRPRCSFDTYFYRCNLVATYFWATGLPEAPVSVKFAHVDGQTRRVQGETLPQPESAYESWVMQAIQAGDLARIVRYRDNAFALGAWLDGREYDLVLLNAAPSELIVSVFKSSPGSVEAGLRRQVASKLPAALVDRATRTIYQHTDELNLYRQLRQGIELPHLLETLYKSYEAERFAGPTRSELKALAELLEKHEAPMFSLFVTFWSSPDKELPKSLKRAEEADYRQFVKLASTLRLIEPLKLLVPGRGEAFLDIYLATRPEDLPKLVEALIEAKEFTSLSRLTGYLGGRSGKDLKKIERMIADEEDTPPAFLQAVTQAIEALPPDEGFKGFLKSVWRRLPGQD
jgi:hypothetical protein